MKKNINIKVILANNFFKKLKGIMFIKEKINYGILFKKVSSIHTFFCFQNIDIVMMDKNYKVNYIFKNFGKNKFITKKNNVYYTLELPSHFIDTKNIKINDVINLTNIQK